MVALFTVVDVMYVHRQSWILVPGIAIGIVELRNDGRENYHIVGKFLSDDAALSNSTCASGVSSAFAQNDI